MLPFLLSCSSLSLHFKNNPQPKSIVFLQNKNQTKSPPLNHYIIYHGVENSDWVGEVWDLPWLVYFVAWGPDMGVLYPPVLAVY